MAEELGWYLWEYATLLVGLAVVWFFAPAIHRALPMRSDTLRNLTVWQWVAIGVVIIASAAASAEYLITTRMFEHDSGVRVLVAAIGEAVSVWQPCLLAIVGGLLVITRRLAIRLSIALAVLLSLAYWQDAIMDSARFVTLRPPLFLFYLVWDALPELLGSLLCLWSGALVYKWWTDRQERAAQLPAFEGGFEQAQQPETRAAD
jgi:hypothetical protein